MKLKSYLTEKLNRESIKLPKDLYFWFVIISNDEVKFVTHRSGMFVLSHNFIPPQSL